MKRIKLIILFVLLSGSFVSAFADTNETLTIMTFYPLPYGSYDKLHVANKLGIGTTNPGLAKLTVENGAISHDENNTFYGDDASVATHINLGLNSTTGTNGQNYYYCTVAGGNNNSAMGNASFIGGGVNNLVNMSANYTAIGGGASNFAGENYTVVGGGFENNAGGSYSVIIGGNSNTHGWDCPYSTIIGGDNNLASGINLTDGSEIGYTLVGGGSNNKAQTPRSFVIGGFNNNASGEEFSTVVGGRNNRAIAEDATVIGGFGNTAGEGVVGEAEDSVVAGGYNNTAAGWICAIGGGAYNTIASGNGTGGINGTIVGGWNNTISMPNCTIGGGYDNVASGNFSTIGGGHYNVASGWQFSTIGGGSHNLASGEDCTVVGGYMNTAGPGDDATVIGGYNNNASGYASTILGGSSNIASGDFSTVSGGQYNNATGDYSWVGGRRANVQSDKPYSFVWDGHETAPLGAGAPRTFNVGALGGFFFNGADVAEHMNVAESQIAQETELVSLIGTDLLGQTKSAYDANLLGVISSKKMPALHFGNAQDPKEGTQRLPVALVGRCYVKVCAEEGNIELGDAVTSSSIPGTGMKAAKSGKIIGYAMEKADFKDTKEIKEILVFVKLGYRLCPEDSIKLAKLEK